MQKTWEWSDFIVSYTFPTHTTGGHHLFIVVSSKWKYNLMWLLNYLECLRSWYMNGWRVIWEIKKVRLLPKLSFHLYKEKKERQQSHPTLGTEGESEKRSENRESTRSDEDVDVNMIGMSVVMGETVLFHKNTRFKVKIVKQRDLFIKV